MIQSVTILGRQPALGLAELESLYGAAAVSEPAPFVAGLALPTEQVDFKRLGGSTRLATVVAEVPNNLWRDVEKQLLKTVVELARELPEGKVQLGLSTCGIPITTQKLNATGLQLKKVLRAKTGKSVRVTPNPELELNTAQVLHNHLTGATGIELLVISTHAGTTLIARTTDVQDIDSYTLRDRGRPKRDARVGMLPPKLAQVLINLAVGQIANPDDRLSNSRATILDPFCGTGVVLQEALLMGYNAAGSDLEQRMVDYTTQNLQWLSEQFSDLPGYDMAVGDATNTQWKTSDFGAQDATRLPMDIGAVATETYLGRPFTERPTSELIAQTSTEVNLILKKFLRNIHSQLAPGTPLCLAVPAWQTTPGEFKHLPLIDQLPDLGYNRTRFEHARDSELVYFREDQFTARQLLVLTRN